MKVTRDFPSGPMVKTTEGVGLIPVGELRSSIPHGTAKNWKKKKKKVTKGLPLDFFFPLF